MKGCLSPYSKVASRVTLNPSWSQRKTRSKVPPWRKGKGGPPLSSFSHFSFRSVFRTTAFNNTYYVLNPPRFHLWLVAYCVILRQFFNSFWRRERGKRLFPNWVAFIFEYLNKRYRIPYIFGNHRQNKYASWHYKLLVISDSGHSIHFILLST